MLCYANDNNNNIKHLDYLYKEKEIYACYTNDDNNNIKHHNYNYIRQKNMCVTLMMATTISSITVTVI